MDILLRDILDVLGTVQNWKHLTIFNHLKNLPFKQLLIHKNTTFNHNSLAKAEVLKITYILIILDYYNNKGDYAQARSCSVKQPIAINPSIFMDHMQFHVNCC